MLSGRTDSSWATSDGEAVVQKDAGIETVIRLLETAAYESLRSAAKEGKLASAMQLDVLNIIEMVWRKFVYFGSNCCNLSIRSLSLIPLSTVL